MNSESYKSQNSVLEKSFFFFFFCFLYSRVHPLRLFLFYVFSDSLRFESNSRAHEASYSKDKTKCIFDATKTWQNHWWLIDDSVMILGHLSFRLLVSVLTSRLDESSESLHTDTNWESPSFTISEDHLRVKKWYNTITYDNSSVRVKTHGPFSVTKVYSVWRRQWRRDDLFVLSLRWTSTSLEPHFRISLLQKFLVGKRLREIHLYSTV